MLTIKNKSILKNLEQAQQKEWNLFSNESGKTTQIIRPNTLKNCLKNAFLPTILNLINQS